MIDIHHHLLYGLDDGPRDLETSCAMVDAAVANGFTHVVATPHANDRWAFTPEINRERLAEIEAYAAGRLTLGLGCDFHLSYDNIQDQFKNPAKYTINGLQYLLVEFPDYGIQPGIAETLYEFVASGVIPIITHPERNATLQAKPEMMAEWIRTGCIVQVTAGSLLGRFGPRAQALSHSLLRHNWVTLLASDAHNLSSRPPNLGDGHASLAKDYGQEIADRLCIHNPHAVFYGKTLPPQPDPLEFGDESEGRNKSLLSRIFSR
ncbi:Manganese-dependent protein-tyrosine phosphatase [Acidisarcina polymorpha]|uniref:protein-tyrosine-phosphatase n=1 Tax=Acidisarcina polymorpha TaxID=2211140 RepID=A0A2Z5FVL4_9BACT|nr:CpsB/CapC family capsule biosynthesis tyrosine phosphatase [Acidisarcina polymorpha]AXC10405.1 Manganese-dependent protein-tyrosine phosphatase [Acidisarcina polymorpha]